MKNVPWFTTFTSRRSNSSVVRSIKTVFSKMYTPREVYLQALVTTFYSYCRNCSFSETVQYFITKCKRLLSTDIRGQVPANKLHGHCAVSHSVHLVSNWITLSSIAELRNNEVKYDSTRSCFGRILAKQ